MLLNKSPRTPQVLQLLKQQLPSLVIVSILMQEINIISFGIHLFGHLIINVRGKTNLLNLRHSQNTLKVKPSKENLSYSQSRFWYPPSLKIPQSHQKSLKTITLFQLSKLKNIITSKAACVAKMSLFKKAI